MPAQATNSNAPVSPDDLYLVMGRVVKGEASVKTALAVARQIYEHHGVSVMRDMLDVIKGSQGIFDDSPQGQRFQEVVEAIDGFLRPSKVSGAYIEQFRIA